MFISYTYTYVYTGIYIYAMYLFREGAIKWEQRGVGG